MSEPEPLPTVERSRLMSRIGGKDTKPEMIVRRLLHSRGYRYSLHPRDLPGRPDIVFRRRRKAIFVHGCFWHRHPGCRRTTTPRTRTEFWQAKFDANVERDAKAVRDLHARGWSVETVWECETSGGDELLRRLEHFLGPPGRDEGLPRLAARPSNP